MTNTLPNGTCRYCKITTYPSIAKIKMVSIFGDAHHTTEVPISAPNECEECTKLKKKALELAKSEAKRQHLNMRLRSTKDYIYDRAIDMLRFNRGRLVSCT